MPAVAIQFRKWVMQQFELETNMSRMTRLNCTPRQKFISEAQIQGIKQNQGCAIHVRLLKLKNVLQVAFVIICICIRVFS